MEKPLDACICGMEDINRWNVHVLWAENVNISRSVIFKHLSQGILKRAVSTLHHAMNWQIYYDNISSRELRVEILKITQSDQNWWHGGRNISQYFSSTMKVISLFAKLNNLLFISQTTSWWLDVSLNGEKTVSVTTVRSRFLHLVQLDNLWHSWF